VYVGLCRSDRSLTVLLLLASPSWLLRRRSHALEGDEERSLAVGMDAYLAKPIRTLVLLAVLDEMRAAWL